MPRTGRKTAAKLTPLAPWFVSKDAIYQLRRILPPAYHRRFSTYFERYGCIRCRRKDRVYGASGLCLPCHGLIDDRLKRCDEILKGTLRQPPDDGREEYLRRVSSARKLSVDHVPTVDALNRKKNPRRWIHAISQEDQ